MKRAIGIGALVLLVALGGAVWWLVFSLDATVERMIERLGSETLGTPVSVSSVDIELPKSRATIRGLRVANPPGFSSKHAISLDAITVGIDVSSVRGSPIVLTEVSATAPAVRLEANEAGALNLDVLRRNASSREPAQADAAEKPTRLRIQKLVIAQGRVEGDASSLGGREVQATLATVRLSNLEGTPSEIGQTLATEVLRRAATASARAGVRGVVEKELKERLGDQAAEAAKGLLRGLTGEQEQ